VVILRKTKNVSLEELQAFFRACEKNGVSVSSTPKSQHRRDSIIVGVNGERYRLTNNLANVLEQLNLSASVPDVSVRSARLGRSSAKSAYGTRKSKAAYRRGTAKKGKIKKLLK
jgi:hypothetical protein